MRRTLLSLFLTSLPLGASLAPAALAAQGPLVVGRTAAGAISAADPKMADGTNYDEWTFTAKGHRRYQIAMNAESFDAYLSIGRGHGSDYQQIATDDDGGGGTNALLTFYAPADGDFTVRANTVREGETGDYTLTLTDLGEPAPVRPVAIAPGQVVSGSIAIDDATGTEGKPTDYYKFTARAGRKYAVTMLSQAFDAVVDVGRGSNGSFERSRTDDDGGGGTNARLEWVPSAAGEVWIAAHTLNADTGRYTILLEDLGDAPPPVAPTFLKPGNPVSGTLGAGDETGEQGFYDSYEIDAQEGQVVVIRMDSDDFDPIVAIGQGDPSDWKELDKDDDGGLGTNAHLEYRIPETGRYVVRAYSIGRRTGSYRIKLETE